MTPEYLALSLRESGAITTEAVHRAFAHVRREAFVPECWVRDAHGARVYLSHFGDDTAEQAWLEAVYSDNSLVTKLDSKGVAVSSSSQPTVMARMLEALDARPGHEVLEIGTGTGYNTALLCELVGADHIVSVDIDPDFVDAARGRLKAEGYRPRLAAGDGRIADLGGPWDRIIATCETSTVPPEWVRRCKSGAVIVVNIGYGTARLTIAADGTATGRFLEGFSAFMPARGEAGAADPGLRIDVDGLAALDGRGAAVPQRIHTEAFQVLLKAIRPDLTQLRLGEDESAFGDGAGRRLLVDGEVLRGDLDLWDEITAAYDRWKVWGHPSLHDLTVSVTADGRTDFQPRGATASV